MSEKEQNKRAEPVTVDWAYEVINTITEAADRVSAKPELQVLFAVSLQKSFPDLLDALLAITELEHRQKMAEFVKSIARMNGTCLKTIRR